MEILVAVIKDRQVPAKECEFSKQEYQGGKLCRLFLFINLSSLIAQVRININARGINSPSNPQIIVIMMRSLPVANVL